MALTAQQLDFSGFPDLAAEFAILTQTGPPDAVYLDGDFASARPFIFGGSYDGFDTALDCLTTAAWYEAGDDQAGQRSVIQVVLNRVSHRSFPKSVCAVVFQGSERVTGCQFSFTCDGSMQRRLPSQAAWERARKRALTALSGAVDPTVGQATHFHADYVAPVWASEMEPLAQVGAHKFYRWPGKRGSLLGFPAFAPEMARASLSELGADQARIDDILDAPFDDSPFEPESELLTPPPQAVMAAAPLIEPGIGEFAPQLEAMTAAAPLIEPGIDALAPQPEAVMDAASSPNAGGKMFLEVTGEAKAGRWALDALARCEGRSACQVDGNRLEPAEARDRPAFLFLRDPVSKMDVALWDCERITRPNAEECLPTSGAALDQLMLEPAREAIPTDGHISQPSLTTERTELAH